MPTKPLYIETHVAPKKYTIHAKKDLPINGFLTILRCVIIQSTLLRRTIWIDHSLFDIVNQAVAGSRSFFHLALLIKVLRWLTIISQNQKPYKNCAILLIACAFIQLHRLKHRNQGKLKFNFCVWPQRKLFIHVIGFEERFAAVLLC